VFDQQEQCRVWSRLQWDRRDQGDASQ